MTPERLSYLVDNHAAALELYAAQWTDHAADVVQDSFVQLIRQADEPENVVPWLYRVVRNRAISIARSEHRKQKHEQAAARRTRPWFVAQLDAGIDAQTAEAALRSLSVEQREVIVARIWGGLSFQQIAEVSEISSSSAHRRFEAGLQAIRDKLGITWPK